MEALYIAGDSDTNSEASLVIAFEKHPNIVTDKEHPDYNEDLDKYYYSSIPVIHVNFNQVDMKTGTFQRVTRIFYAWYQYRIDLSENILIDRSNYFGLIHTEPEAQTFFSVESLIIYGTERFRNRQEKALGEPIVFTLSDISKTYEREVYTFMEVLGDFGGFNDGIMLFPAIFMSIYSNKMFLQNLFRLLPVKKRTSSSSGAMMRKSFSSNQSPIQLTEVDT